MSQQGKNNAILFLKNEEIYIPLFFKRIGEVSENIFMELIHKKFYKVESNVKKSSLESFIEYWLTGELPEIKLDNYWDFHLLSEEFGMMKDHLSKPEYEHIHKICLLKSFHQDNNQNNTDKFTTEKSISQNLDFYLENHSDDFFTIPITSLYNIFYNESRIIANEKRAYELITEKSVNNKKLLILLPSIKAEKLNIESVIDSSIKIIEHDGFSPQITPRFIDSIKKFKKDTIDENRKMKNLIIQMKKSHELSEKQLKENHLNQIKSLQLNHENDFKKQEEKYLNQIKEIRSKHENELKQQKENHLNEMQKIQSNHLNELKQQEGKYLNQIKEIQLKYENILKQQRENVLIEMQKMKLNHENELKQQNENNLIEIQKIQSKYENELKQQKENDLNKRKNIPKSTKIDEINQKQNKKSFDDDDKNLFKSQKIDFSKSRVNKTKKSPQTQKFSQTLKSIKIKEKPEIDILFIIDGTKFNEEEYDSLSEKIANIAFDFLVSCRFSSRKIGCICCHDSVDKSDSPLSQKYLDFSENDIFFGYLDDIKKNFEIKPFNYTEILNKAINGLSWRKGTKAIICISGSSIDNNEQKNLNEIVVKLADQDIGFIGLYINAEAFESFSYLKKIYDDTDGPLFYIEKIENQIVLSELLSYGDF